MKTKQEMVELFASALEIKTQKEALEKFNALEEALLNELMTEGGYKFAGVVVKQVEKKASEGVSKLGGVEKPWTKPAHMSVNAKVSKVVKDAVYKEI